MQCPQCGSDSVRRLSVIHEEGLSNITTTSGTVAVGSGGTASAYTETEGTAQTQLSQRAAPPKKESTIKLALMHVVGFLVISLLISTIFGIGGSWIMGVISLAYIAVAIFHLVHNFKFNRTEFPARLAQWQRSFMCLSCGRVVQD